MSIMRTPRVVAHSFTIAKPNALNQDTWQKLTIALIPIVRERDTKGVKQG
jgi:hypothetical protein